MPSSIFLANGGPSAAINLNNAFKKSAFHGIKKGDCEKKKGTYWSALVTAHLQ